ncbi:MAG: methionyl aminopeptidase [Syntrophomonas sp.]|uniref:methionyl aminopeptidase n=1 Tax=Syntrophomonas sp. TaxID=2053627 RepID=UPI00262158CC|nr:methionyl aminopeptidase [Syntrophomonas sp.]MDD2510741.1 methionyl aminopeptidase [Syntrophomonas sp.]MDD3879623.1 methionyl aminopeptidase [Syntrophomonas sp.]MDD4627129.1 methionyl aminopeptidase [Syntrophomonas sp.]
MALSRNDSCWCGSGKKYKKCHMEQDLYLEDFKRKGILVPDRKLIKTEVQIEGIRRSCQLTKSILNLVAERIEAGISTAEIDRWVNDALTVAGAYPATLNYQGFPASVCTSINEVICHGIPSERKLKEGDIVNVDITSILDGYYGDASRMFLIGEVSAEAQKLVQVARECLYLGIEQVKPFNRIGDIAFAIEQHANKHGFSVVRDFGGHGVGLAFHEDPFVAHYGPRDSGMLLVPNMVFTVEPMVNVGTYRCRKLDDGWTTVTADNSLSAQWEHTVRVSETGVEVMTE